MSFSDSVRSNIGLGFSDSVRSNIGLGFSDSVQCNIGLVSPTISHQNVSHIVLIHSEELLPTWTLTLS